MLSFLKLFFRDALRNRTFTILNIVGLAVGMAVFILIMFWVSDELSYDSYNLNADRIYRTNMYYKYRGVEKNGTWCPAPMAEALKNNFAEVEKTVRFRNYSGSIIQYGDKVFSEDNLIYADSTVFDIFTIPVIKGNASEALKAPNTVAISESMAKKYFGTEDPVNKVLRFDNTYDYLVTAVYKDIPRASHFHFDFIASLYSTDEYRDQTWLSANFKTYVLLHENADPGEFEKKLSGLLELYVIPQAVQGLGQSWEELQKTSDLMLSFSIQNVRDIHLTTGISGEFEASGDIKYIYIFSLVAVFIILLACINFTNLSTARAITRTREVGIRKVFGVSRKRLSLQFIMESFLIVFIAHILAMIIAELALPYFNDLTGKNIVIEYLNIRFVGFILGLIIIVSLLAGSYPAFYLSSFNPVSVLRKEMITGRKKARFRSVLVIGQFVISLVLLSSSLVLYMQMKYIQNKDLGYDKEQLLVIENTYLLGKNIDNFKDQLRQNPAIQNITQSGFLPSPSSRNNGAIFPDGILSNQQQFCTHFLVDYDYINTFGMKIINGRAFSKDYSSDSSAVIINEATAKLLGYDDPVGRKIGTFKDSYDPQNPKIQVYNIIGVVKDFNHSSLHEPVAALAMYLERSRARITCKIMKDIDLSGLIAFIEAKWKENAPDQPFEYDFVTESLDRQYSGEIRLGKILGIFTLLAFFISFLGLIGLALFASEQRSKEIGIRKVNGSGILNIVWLLTSDFTKLLVIAFIIACPLSWYLMSRWLEGFAYHMDLSWWLFLLTGLISYLTAMIAVGYFTYKAAATNPVEILKNE